MRERIGEAILSGSCDDYFLGLLLEIVIPSIRDNRYVFPNPLHEPVLYRHFIFIVRETLEELAKVEEGMESAFKKSMGMKVMGGE